MSTITTDRLLELAPEAIPLPQTTVRIVQLTNQPDSSMTELAQVLEQDQALSARVLRVANSAYFGLPRQVTSIRDAVVLLGQSTLRSLVFTASVVGVLGREVAGYGLGKGALWQHSVAAARAARHLSERVGLDSDEAYVAGLLHDIGKIVLDQYMQDEFARALDLTTDDGIPFDQAERSVFGVDHAEIGGVLAERWELPARLVDAIRHHHRPSAAQTAPRLTAAVHVADLVCLELGLGMGREGLQYIADPKAFVLLELDEAGFSELAGVVADHLNSPDLLLD